MDYPLGNVSQPVTGSEARKIAIAIKTGGYVTNETAIVAREIAERRRQKQAANNSQK